MDQLLDRATPTADAVASSLKVLEAAVARDLSGLQYGKLDWVPKTPGVDHDVLVVGAGQNGLALAFGLKRQGISNIKVIDRAKAGNVGVWRTSARMPTLRTLPDVTGPELGIASLSFRQWFDACHGTGAFARIIRIDRKDWAEYLDWFRDMISIPIDYDWRLVSLSPHRDELLKAEFVVAGTPVTKIVRKAILATGEAGSGKPAIPACLERLLSSGLVVHTDEAIDFSSMKDKIVAVVGAGSSAFDAAAEAIAAGALSVTMLCRQEFLSAAKPTEAVRYLLDCDNFYNFHPAEKWKLIKLLRSRSAPPPPHSVEQVINDPRFSILFGAEIEDAQKVGRALRLHAAGRTHDYGFVVLGTGHTVGPRHFRELVAFAPYIATWRDRVCEPNDTRLLDFPFLGDGCEFTEIKPGDCPALGHVICFNAAGNVSFGRHFGEIQGVTPLATRVVGHLSHRLFVADQGRHAERIGAAAAAAIMRRDVFAEPRLKQSTERTKGGLAQ